MMEFESYMTEPAGTIPPSDVSPVAIGLTKLEWMAGQVIQGLLSNPDKPEMPDNDAPEFVVFMAMEILKACHDAETENAKLPTSL